jgi:hypothetical protein
MTTNTAEAAADEPLAYTISGLAKVSTISRTEIYDDINAGLLIAKRRGKRRFVLADEAKRWLESHEDN